MKKRFIGFRSTLAGDIQSYIHYKRALGNKFISEESALRLFDRFLMEIELTDIQQLTASLLEKFLVSRPRHRPRSYNHLLGVIRCFLSWLVTQERLNINPLKTCAKRRPSKSIPFLFKPSHFRRLLQAVCSLPDRGGALHRGEVYSIIFTLMYSLGLRVGEVSRLCYSDVDLNRKLLIIRDTKFGKSRFVPFGPKIERLICAYLGHRRQWFSQRPQEDFLFSFSTIRKMPIHPCTISQTFHHLVTKLMFPRPPSVEPPRLHCLRHSFAVETLLNWYKNGVDPNRRLFHLSTFMGHTDPSSTAWYLTITDELLQEANTRFEDLMSSVLQGVAS